MTTLRHRLEGLFLSNAIAWLQRGSLESAFARTRRLARLSSLLLRSEWHWARTNPQLIFGNGLTGEGYSRLAALAVENIFLSHLEGVRVTDIRVRDEGAEHLLAAHARGRGVVACAVHLGSWEPGLRHVGSTLGLPLATVYRHANNPLAEALFTELRQPYGCTWIPRREPRAIVTALLKKQVLGLMVDINTREGGIVAPFLGVPALCPAGPARLAMRFQAPVVPLVCVREAPGEACLKVGEILEPPEKQAGEEEEHAFTARIQEAFTPWIVEYAEQYNWLHGRWRSRPDGRHLTRKDPVEALLRERTTPPLPLHPRVRRLLES
ncbi:MAG: lysophospholipid acyltransferase family protein [Magnetococcales bacterium]|nr:lysophospholipid acyltransferase family protein [Magnetococcales bacterium]